MQGPGRPDEDTRDGFVHGGWAQRGRSWTSLQQMQTAAVDWSTTLAGCRPHRSLDGVAPITMFSTVSQPVMRALPMQRFEIAVWSRPKVAADCHVSVAGVETAFRASSIAA